MFGRMTLGSLFVLAVLIPGLCQAQSGYGYGPNGPLVYASPASELPPQTLGNQPAVAGYQGPQQSPNTIYEQLPDDLGFLYDDTPFEKLIEDTFRHAYFRSEYLLWSISAPQPNLLGQVPAGGFFQSTTSQPPINGTTGSPPNVPSPSISQPIYPNTYGIEKDPTSPTGASASAIEPSLAGFDIRNLNGYRGTMGMPVGPGALELSAFILATGANTWNGTPFITPAIPAVAPAIIGTDANYIGQVVTIDGAQHNLLYTGSYETQMHSSMWGSEANYILNAPNKSTGDFFTISPLVGLRYLNFRETLAEGGSYQYLTNPTNPLSTALSTANRSIYSQSNNHAYGFQFGVRSEMAVSRVVFGAEPKVMFGVNTYDAGLSTSPLDVSIAQGTSNVYNTALNFQKTATTFSPIGDLKLYTRLNISQYVNLYFSYNIMWAGSLSRPYNNMSYNFASNGTGMFNPTFSDVVVQGLSFGGEIRY